MSWLITPTQNAFITDADARAYVNAVEAADRQTLEPAVTQAIVNFVVDCKSDGVWNAIKASCILAGARSLAGALVPLKGAAPTNNNYTDSDYNRKLGVLNASGKSISSNRLNNADPQDNNHNSVYLTSIGLSTMMALSGGNNVLRRTINSNGVVANRSTDTALGNNTISAPVFYGTSRSSNSEYTVQRNTASSLINAISATPTSDNIQIASAGEVRINFYSIGESLDLTLLNTRVTTLINAIAAAIP